VAKAHSVNTAITAQTNRDSDALNNNWANVEKEKDANFLRDNLDHTLMHAKALKAGANVLSRSSIKEIKYTTLDNTNTTQVLAQAFASFNQVNSSLKM
jgi:predicted Zn-dependent protease